MQELKDRKYVGSANEPVSVTTVVGGGGQAQALLDGQPQSLPSFGFPLPAKPGQSRQVEVRLVGPVGASCVVIIRTVDGGDDRDLLLFQGGPVPIQLYDFATAPASALAQLAGSGASAAKAKAAAKKTSKRGPTAAKPKKKNPKRRAARKNQRDK